MGWVTGHAIAIFSALLAALWAAVGIVVRQRVARAVPADKGMSTEVATTVFREPMWWAGMIAAIAGYVFQAVALAHGSLLLVQPLLVSSLLFALPLNARLARQRVPWADWGWATLLTAALAVFVLVGQPSEGHNRPAVPAWTLALAISVPLVIVCVAAARRAIGTLRAMLLAIPVAVLLGMVAVLTKICAHRVAVDGWHSLLTVPAPYVLVAAALALTFVQQAAFHAGAMQASVPIMLVGEPIVAVLLGMVVLGEHVGVHGPRAAVLILAVLAMGASTVALARDQVTCTENSMAPQALSDADTTSAATAGRAR